MSDNSDSSARNHFNVPNELTRTQYNKKYVKYAPIAGVMRIKAVIQLEEFRDFHLNANEECLIAG